MKIYYSKYVGYGFLAFACALFIHLAFLSLLGLRNSQSQFRHPHSDPFISNCDLCNHCWDQKTD